MRVSLNTNHLCNFRCTYCYLTKEQLSDKTVLPFEKLVELLSMVDDLEEIELYGGEVSLLDESYIRNIIELYGHLPISVITNGYIIKDWFYDERITLNVSYDFDVRPHSEKVFHNIITMGRDISINILVTPELIARDVMADIKMINSLANVKNVELKPYSSNQSNQHNFDIEYLEYVAMWVEHSDKTVTTIRLQDPEDYRDSPHVFITPQGKFAILSFDENNNEYFKEIDIANINTILDEEYALVQKSCGDCKYVFKCLTEHYKPTDNSNNDFCSGGKILIEAFETNGRMEGEPRGLSRIVSERIRTIQERNSVIVRSRD